MSTGTAPIPQLKVKSCKLKNDWKMIAYVFEVYPESFTKNEGGIHHNENHIFRENFKKWFYTKFIEESKYRIHFDQKLTQRLLYSVFWDWYLKNLWKIYENFSLPLS